MSEGKDRAAAPPVPLPEPPADFDPLSEETVSALPSLLGMRLIEWRDGFAALSWEMGPEAINRQGVAHGGATATLLDTAAGYAPVFCPYPGRRRRAFTLSLDLQFVGAIRPEDGPVRAEGRVTGGGASIAFVEAIARNKAGLLVAKAQGVFRLRTDSRSLWGAPR